VTVAKEIFQTNKRAKVHRIKISKVNKYAFAIGPGPIIVKII
jgi:hypothetical protein